MLLIDKDALEEAVQGAINIMESHGISMIAASVPLAIIKGAPTIDAISVEWLKQIQAGCVCDTAQVPMYVAIGWLIDMWQKEQEAQDGAEAGH